METLDHQKIQRQTVLEAAGLVFYSLPPPSTAAPELLCDFCKQGKMPLPLSRAHFNRPGVQGGYLCHLLQSRNYKSHPHTTKLKNKKQKKNPNRPTHRNNLPKYLKEKNFKILKVILMETDVILNGNKLTFSSH